MIFGVFEPDWIWTLSPLCAFLWASGGSGPKWMREWLVPAAIILYAIGYGFPSSKAAYLLTLLFIPFAPGYGDDFVQKLGKLYWPYVFLLGFLYGACQAGLCAHFGRVDLLLLFSGVCSLVFGGTMLASKKLGLQWKIAEILTGAAVGLVAVKVIIGS